MSLATRLGLTAKGRNRFGPCPVCREATDSTGRGALHRSGATWHCNASGCGEALSDARLVKETLGLSWTEAYAWLEGTEARAVRQEPEPEPVRPDRAILAQELARARTPPAAALDQLGLPPEVARHAGWLPHTPLLRPGYPLVVPAFTGTGEIASLQGRSVPTRTPKTACPTGYDFAGLLFLDRGTARPFFRGTGPAPETLLIVEGLTDYLTAVAHADATIGVVGIVSGSAAALRLVAPRVHEHRIRVVSAMDVGPQGDQYTRKLADAFAPHPVFPLDLQRLAPLVA